MPSSSLTHHARTLVTLQPSPPRLSVAVKASTTMAVPLALGQVTGHLSLALLASLGIFTILYGPSSPGRFRARILGLVGLGLTTCVALGALTAGHPVLVLVALVGVAGVAAFVCQSLQVGPPGAFFFVLVTGVSEQAVTHGVAAMTAIFATMGGATLAWLIGMADLLVDPHRPERRLVDQAEAAVESLEAADTDSAGRAAEQAATALHRAWTGVTDGGAHPAELDRVRALQGRYSLVAARLASERMGADDVDIDAEQLRDTSLGRPRAWRLLRNAASWPSEVLLVVGRVLVATTAAGVVATLTHRGHAYWAVAFAMLVLHQGGTRASQTLRGVQRLLGTLAGLALFGAMAWAGVGGWGLVVAVCLLQLVIELLVVRNYALAVMFITPLALTIGTASTPGVPLGRTIVDRASDTVIAVVVALATAWLTGRRRPELILRGHARRVVVAIEAVMADVAGDRLGTDDALQHRRELYHELVVSDAVAQRAVIDSPDEVGGYRRVERAVSRLGYTVLGACWHPDLRRAHDAFARAQVPLARVTGTPVRARRPADEIEQDVREVERLLADWR